MSVCQTEHRSHQYQDQEVHDELLTAAAIIANCRNIAT